MDSSTKWLIAIAIAIATLAVGGALAFVWYTCRCSQNKGSENNGKTSQYLVWFFVLEILMIDYYWLRH